MLALSPHVDVWICIEHGSGLLLVTVQGLPTGPCCGDTIMQTTLSLDEHWMTENDVQQIKNEDLIPFPFFNPLILLPWVTCYQEKPM